MLDGMTKAIRLNSVCNSAYFKHHNILAFVGDSLKITTTSPLARVRFGLFEGFALEHVCLTMTVIFLISHNFLDKLSVTMLNSPLIQRPLFVCTQWLDRSQKIASRVSTPQWISP
jgi:hypothetical protein